VPLVRISLARGKSPEFRQGIADAVHESLVEVFSIPALDRFQVVEEVDPANLFFPPSYMDIPHTGDIIYVQIVARAGRSLDLKRRLFARIAERAAARTEHNPDDIVIVLVENTSEDWSFGRGEAQYAPATPA
jgi:4-oxalocrotonate tautomerase